VLKRSKGGFGSGSPSSEVGTTIESSQSRTRGAGLRMIRRYGSAQQSVSANKTATRRFRAESIASSATSGGSSERVWRRFIFVSDLHWLRSTAVQVQPLGEAGLLLVFSPARLARVAASSTTQGRVRIYRDNPALASPQHRGRKGLATGAQLRAGEMIAAATDVASYRYRA